MTDDLLIKKLEIRQVPAANAWAWIVSGFELFKAYPAMWVVLFIIYLAIVVPISLIPILGSVASTLIAPVFAAGMMVGCLAVTQKHELVINHLFEGFKKNTAQLIAVGGIYMLALLVVAIFVVLNLDKDTVSLILKGQELTPAQASAAVKPSILIAALLLIPVLMAYWFAPLLVRLHNLTAIEAMKLSFTAVLRNIVPVILYMLIFLALTLLALIPLGLGLLVVVPLMMTSTYTCYEDIFNIKQV
jgi:uncharacterized membrane protein